MSLEFDTNSVTIVEFGVGYDHGSDYSFFAVPVSSEVRSALLGMVRATFEAMTGSADELVSYEPSEKYQGTEYCYIALSDPLASVLRNLHESTNLDRQSSVDVLHDPSAIACYFARMRDANGRRMTAIRRAIQFKGVLNKKLLSFVDDSMQFLEGDIFKLDVDFDVVIADDVVHIWRPSSFAFLGRLKQAILDAVPANIAEIQSKMSFVDFGSIEEYAKDRPRAARYLASIRTQNLQGIDPSALKRLCDRTNVEIDIDEGRIVVEVEHAMGFLEVLDRRRYVDDLDPATPDSYRASSRQKLR